MKLTKTPETEPHYPNKGEKFLLAAISVHDDGKWQWPSRAPLLKRKFFDLFKANVSADQRDALRDAIDKHHLESYITNTPSVANRHSITKYLNVLAVHTRPGASRTIRQHYYWNTEKDIYDSIANARHLFSSLPPRPQWYDRDLPDGDPGHFPDKVDPARTLWKLSLSDARAHLSTMSDDDEEGGVKI